MCLYCTYHHPHTGTEVHQETAEYQAFRSKKKAEQCEALCQASPSKLGGPRLSDSDVASMREKQEKQARLDAKFDSIRKRVCSYFIIIILRVYSMCLGEEREIYC